MNFKLDLVHHITPLLQAKLLWQKINKISAVGLVVCSVFPTSLLAVESSYAHSTFDKSNYIAQTKQSSNYRGSYNDFFTALGRRETGQQNPSHNIENQLGFIGKYQFGEALLIDTGYYQAKVYYGNGANRNNWQGRWTGKNGINSKQEFLNNKNNVQETAIREAFALNWNRLNDALKQKGHSVKQFIGSQRGGVVVTTSGLLAAAHLRGSGNVVNLLINNQGSNDENGTSILAYLREFAGFQTPFN